MAPTVVERLLPFSERCIVNETGKIYNHHAYPHLGAPGGPMDAFDLYSVREIALQFSSRLGKTFFGQSCTIYNGTRRRIPQMFASPKEELSSQVVQRTYKMIRQVPEVNRCLAKPLRLQQQHLIEFWGCCVFVGWARSAATLADKDAIGGHAGEFDDWDHLTTSKDGDPGDQFSERFKNHWNDRKVVYESIPKIRSKSRIERKRLLGTNCNLQVPCPRCQQYQVLQFGSPDSKFGVKWQIVDGLVQAWYECIHCNGRIESHERSAMMRRGVWCPEGCKVKSDVATLIDCRAPDYEFRGWKYATWIDGKPARDGEIASYQLSSLYALSLSWRDIAKAFLDCKNQPQRLRNFKNQWLAETWEIRRSRTEPEALAARLKTDYAKSELPIWTDTVAMAIDRQKAEGGFVKFLIVASGPDNRWQEIDYGSEDSLELVWEKYANRPYYRVDGSGPLFVKDGPTAIDSGWQPTVTYDFCRDEDHPNCVPCKGGSTDNADVAYKWSPLDKSKHETDDLELLLVSTTFTETLLQHLFDSGIPGEPGSIGLSSDAAADMDFINEITNAMLTDRQDKVGEPVLLYVKKDEAFPNDYRDCFRYVLTVVEAWRDAGGPSGESIKQRVVVEQRPDGRNWVED